MRGIEAFNGAVEANALEDYTAPVEIRIGEHVEYICFDVVSSLAHYPIVLGIPWLRCHDAHLDFKENTVSFPSSFCTSHCLPSSSTVQALAEHPSLPPASKPISSSSSRSSPAQPPLTPPAPKPATSAIPPVKIAIVSATAFRLSMKDADVYEFWYEDLETRSKGEGDPAPPVFAAEASFLSMPGTLPEWNDDEAVEFTEHVPSDYHDFADVFNKATADKLPERRSYDHHIPLVDGASLPQSRLYPLSASELDSARKYLDENLKRGFIRPSTSPIAAPILFAKKKDGSLRLCVDYRKLNAITVKNKYPLPLIGETLDRLGRAKVFTKLDLRNGYHHIRIAEGDEWKTAFRTRYGHFEYLVMPFGLTNAPASFQAMMNEIFAEFLDKFVVVYLDDILIYSENKEQHKEHVRQVLEKMRQHRLFANAKKCEFNKSEVEYLGYVVGQDGIKMDEKKVSTIRDWPLPQSLKDVQAFLGFANFYRRFIRNFAAIASPLTRLTRKDVQFDMDGPPTEAFEALKTAFTTAPVLAHFKPGAQCILETDASDFATAAILSQKVHEKVHPIAFYSRKLSPAELNYEIHDKELLPIIEAYRHWRAYLEGANEPTLIYTDHKNLSHFFGEKVLSRRQTRWYETLSGHNYELLHRPGKLNSKADILSRRSDYAVNTKAKEGRPITFFPSTLNISVTYTEPFPELTEALLAAQDEDPAIRQILQDLRLSENLEKHDDRWKIDDQGLLRWDNRVYVPADNKVRLRVVGLCHDVESSAHPGVNRTYERFARLYHFPGDRRYITNYVNTCETCPRAKSRRQRQQGFLKPLPAPTRRAGSLSMDFITKLPKTHSGNDSILVVIDRLTKFGTFVPFTERGTNADDFAKLFYQHIVGSHGLPDDIVSDRGSIFTSDFWQSLQRLTRVRSNLSTSFHPQTDGQTERINQTVEQTLRFYTSYQQDDWDELLPIAQFAYNDTYSASIKTTPFEATYGCSPRLELDIPADLRRGADKDAAAFVKRMAEVHSKVRHEITRAAANAEKYYNQKRSEAATYAPGDKVWLDARNIVTRRPSRKLDWRSHGPFEIIEPVGSHAYRLKLPDQWEIHDVFHVSLLHPHHQDADPDRHPAPPPLTEVDGEMETEVAAVLASRTYKGRLQYFVSWVNEPPSNNLWIDADELANAKDLVEEFHRLHPNSPKAPAARRSSRQKEKASA